MIVTMQGVRAAPLLKNKTTSPNLQLGYLGDLASGDSLAIDVKNYKSMLTPSGDTAVKVNASVTHSGDARLFYLDPDINGGINVLNLSAGTGVTQLAYKGAYL